jgi:hypothetical protein
MSATPQKPGNIHLRIQTAMSESASIPKMVEIFDQSLKSVRSEWLNSNDHVFSSIPPGTYTIRVSMSSGIREDETFDLDDGQTKEVRIGIEDNSPNKSQEWADFNKYGSIKHFQYRSQE